MGTDANTDNLKYLLALRLAEGIGDISAHRLLQHFGSVAAVFAADSSRLRQAGLAAKKIEALRQVDFDRVEEVRSWQDTPDRHIIDLSSSFYPPLLAQLANPPLLLFVLGQLDCLQSPQIAIVGSRSPSEPGKRNAFEFAAALAETGITITSGMALGIDGAAHRGALAKQGYTVAVTGTGLNRVYPASHRELAYAIAEHGALVSECLPDEGVARASFPRRNRIIAGLSLGTLVVEAAARSGSLITAICATEAGREVFAIPGSIHSPLSKGCHQLIRQGAKLVESCEDIVEEISPGRVASSAHSLAKDSSRETLDEADAAFLQFIDYEVTPLDTIIARSQLTVEAVTNKLLLLELQGWIINSVGGYLRH